MKLYDVVQDPIRKLTESDPQLFLICLLLVLVIVIVAVVLLVLRRRRKGRK